VIDVYRCDGKGREKGIKRVNQLDNVTVQARDLHTRDSTINQDQSPSLPKELYCKVLVVRSLTFIHITLPRIIIVRGLVTPLLRKVPYGHGKNGAQQPCQAKKISNLG